MKFTPNQAFLDGHDRFEPEREYDEAPDRVTRFVRAGWVRSDEAEIDPALTTDNHTLEVQKSVLGQEATGV